MRGGSGWCCGMASTKESWEAMHGRTQHTLAVVRLSTSLGCLSCCYLCHFVLRCTLSICVVHTLFAFKMFLNVLWNMEVGRTWLFIFRGWKCRMMNPKKLPSDRFLADPTPHTSTGADLKQAFGSGTCDTYTCPVETSRRRCSLWVLIII